MREPSDGAPATEPHAFSADRPVLSSAEDRLSRATFASRLADSIRSWRGRDSLVIGLYGPWGAGKTSIINLALESLDERDEPPKVIRFNPWEWAGHEELATALFAEIAKALDREKTDRAASLAKRFRAYAHALNASSSIAGAISKVVAAVSTVFLAAGIAVSGVGGVATWVGGVVAVVGAVGVILSQLQSLMEGVSDAIERRSTKTQPLEDVKRGLAEELLQYDRTILFVVDDLDRLAPADAVRMLQLVKANADLPGLVFLLAIDRGGLGRSIRTALRVDGSEYLEKIIQVGFDLPMPDRVSFERLLVDGVQRVIAPDAIQRRFDPERWRQIYAEGILPFLSTPRQVIRYCSMSEFGLQGHVELGECNVDPVDFMGIEVLRQFEPTVHSAIVPSKDFLTGAAQGDERRHERAALRMADILRPVPEGQRRDACRHILKQLFPAAEWADSGAGRAIDLALRKRQRRVSDPESFDYYFQLSVPSHEISEAELKATIRTASDGRSSFAEALRALLTRAVIRAFLLRLRADLGVIPQGQEAVFITALFDIGDDLEDAMERRDILFLSESELAVFLVADLLQRLEPTEREAALEDSVMGTAGLVLPVHILNVLNRQKVGRQPLLEPTAVRRLTQPVLARIEQMAVEGTLRNHRHLAELLEAWAWWGDKEELRAWAEGLASTPEGLGALVVAFTGRGTSDNQHPLVELIDLYAAFSRAQEWLQDESLSADQKSPIRMFIDQIEGRAELFRVHTDLVTSPGSPSAPGLALKGALSPRDADVPPEDTEE